MRTSWLLFSLSFVILFYSCSEQSGPDIRDYVITEKDLIPEGVAFDAATQTIYISSCYKRKIVAISKDGEVKDFIKEGQNDIKSVIGMEVDNKRNCLWAVSSEANEVLPLKDPGEHQWRSSVFRFNLSDGKLVKQYQLNKDSVFLNDLTVAADGTVYVTESAGKALYRIRPGEDTLALFIKFSNDYFINGLCFTDKPELLFVCNEQGILSVNINTAHYSLLPAININAGGIDGLAFHNDYFIAHQSSKVVRLYLSPGRDSIIRSDTLDSSKEFDASTTGEVSGDDYYFIVNSQIQSAYDLADKKIKPMDSLENIIIRRIKL